MRRAFLALAAGALPAAALACGVCVEDKIAATYDHAVVTGAAAHHRVVVFASVEGAAPAALQSRAVERAAAHVRGVDRASIRTAQFPAAVSFALDPRAQSPRAALAAIERAARPVHLVLLRVIE